jgi:beta-mannosidase
VRAERNGSEITVSLKTDRFARSVRLNILDKRADYSDNYFEMDADSEKDITVSLHDAEGIESKVLYIEGENVDRITLSLAEI